ncbi:MAG: YceD family protein [Luteibaculum sp.]
MDVLTEYKIPYVGLKEGQHNYVFKVEEPFFKAFEQSQINEAEIDLEVLLDKKASMVVCDFVFNGKVLQPCDRCTDDLWIDIAGKDKMIFKFHGEGEEDESIAFIPPSQGDIDLAPYVYEFIHLALPLKISHEDPADCNQEVLEKLERLKPKVNINPQWEELLKLKSD